MLQYSMVEIKIVMAYILSSQARLGDLNPISLQYTRLRDAYQRTRLGFMKKPREQ